MGYDMRFRKADPGEAAAVEFARGIFRAACDKRDEIPRDERGVLNMERVKREGIDWDSNEAYDGMSARYAAAQDQVDAAVAEMRAAEKSYFRLNMSGMGWACGVMEQFGMMFDDPSFERTFPDPEDFGTDWDHVSALEDPDEYPDLTFTDEEAVAAAKCREAIAKHLAWHGVEVPGIPSHKFSTNDGWIVLPAEAEAAVRIWKQAYDEMGEDGARVVVALGGERADRAISSSPERADAYWSLWLRWVAYIADSVTHDGFEVH